MLQWAYFEKEFVMLSRVASSSVRRGLAAAVPVLVAVLILSGQLGCGGDGNPGTEPACKVDADCVATPATPYCGAELTCVGCKDSAQCSGATPVCEPTSHTCQACTEDSQCGSGVCLDTLGTCASPGQLIYVKEAGGTNNATCDAQTPCDSIDSVKRLISAQRNVIRVIGPLSKKGDLQTKVTVDGDGSMWTIGNPAVDVIPVLSVSTNASDVTVEGFALVGATVNPTVNCFAGGTLRLHEVSVTGGKISGIAVAGKLTVTKSKIFNNINSAVKCSGANSSMTIEDTEISGNTMTTLETLECAVRMARNRISGNPGAMPLMTLTNASKLEVENNLIWDKETLTASGISVVNGPAAGAIRFNTFVRTTSGTHSGEGVICTGASVVTSNVVAWQSGGTAVVVSPCVRRYNAFDASTNVGIGEGNASAALSALFVNPASDFHLATGSPARALAEPSVSVPVDLEGKARPASGRLDAGAYQTP
jgi:hypothetical protein